MSVLEDSYALLTFVELVGLLLIFVPFGQLDQPDGKALTAQSNGGLAVRSSAPSSAPSAALSEDPKWIQSHAIQCNPKPLPGTNGGLFGFQRSHQARKHNALAIFMAKDYLAK